MLIVRIVGNQAAQVALADGQTLHLVLQDDACMEQSVLYYLVACSLLFVGEWDLCQIVLALVGIECGRIYRL